MTADQPDLFPVAETLSPFAEWKREHDIHTGYVEGGDSLSPLPWAACKGGRFVPTTFGETEEEACAKLAQRLNLPHWLEGRSL